MSHMVSNLYFMLPIVTKWFYINNTCYLIIRDHSDESHKYKEHICTRGGSRPKSEGGQRLYQGGQRLYQGGQAIFEGGLVPPLAPLWIRH